MSAVLTISSVDSTANTLTIAAHGLTSGDKLRPYSPGNGSLPAPLAAATDVYAIRVDANTIKVATTNALALAGTAIDLTNNGSGALYALTGIPYLQATIYGVGSQLKSADLNDMETALRDNWTSGKHGVRTKWRAPAVPGIVGTSNGFISNVDYFTFNVGSPPTSFQGMPLGSFKVGDRLTGVSVKLKGPGVSSNTISLAFYLNKGDGSPTLLIDLAISNPPASWAEYSAQMPTPHTFADGETLYLSQLGVGASGQASYLGPIGFTYDRP